MKTKIEIEKVFEKADNLLLAKEHSDADLVFIEAVRDTLGFVLGTYDDPLEDY